MKETLTSILGYDVRVEKVLILRIWCFGEVKQGASATVALPYVTEHL